MTQPTVSSIEGMQYTCYHRGLLGYPKLPGALEAKEDYQQQLQT